ncbi:uncharacterized protein EURHEDRAFT_348141 [Aspergillus ruber CBS 135680]|uniref:Uncharacterized protein n=1 Tax=Aspergillus ruber (strain CBS 135680) TaxID=1388766 RepID=A0A017S065_ASPRC|nr:uncharacterized protein EURHEDRAFT_348141 [Aspergillus ruber CBS 135680]EYE90014.1 hypothetical protein EURHEDRAFT_348141 [Aspergillus ruber CBS 135680]
MQQEEAPTILPVPLTQAKGNNSLTSLHIEYIQDLPEYPVSHIYGYTYVVAVGNRSQEEMEKLVHDVQYAKKLKWGQKRPVYCPFLNSQVKKWTWTCSGIFACEYLNSYIASYHHTSADDNIWDQIRKYQQDIQLAEAEPATRNAYRMLMGVILLILGVSMILVFSKQNTTEEVL